MVWLRNKYGGWFEVPDDEYIPSSKNLKVGQSFTNKNGVKLKVLEPTKTGEAQWQIGDRVSKGSYETLAKTINDNGYKFDKTQSIVDKNEDLKEKQIAKTKEEAEKLNGKEDYKTIPAFGKVDAKQFTENYAKGSRLQDIKFTDDDIKNWREKGMLPKNAISVTARDYWRTSGRSQPSGYGNWAFKVGNETIFFGGRYSEAKAAIIEYARRKRIYSVDVLG